MDKKLLYDIFIDVLKNSQSNLAPLYRILFSSIKEEELASVLEFTMECYTGKVDLENADWYKENWFYTFHKSIRQTDFCVDSIYKKVVYDKRTEQEKERQAELEQLLYTNWNNSEQKKNKGSRWAFWENNFKAETKEYYSLIKKSKIEEYESWNGYIDSMLWNLIYSDNERVLEKVFIRTFKEYELQFELNNIK